MIPGAVALLMVCEKDENYLGHKSWWQKILLQARISRVHYKGVKVVLNDFCYGRDLWSLAPVYTLHLILKINQMF